MEPGDFISSIYLYVSLVLVSGNCIFNPLNRFNPLSNNFSFPLLSRLLLLHYSCAEAFLAENQTSKGDFGEVVARAAHRAAYQAPPLLCLSLCFLFKESNG